MEQKHKCQIISHVLKDYFCKENQKLESFKPICEECLNKKFIDFKNKQKVEDFLQDTDRRLNDVRKFIEGNSIKINLEQVRDIKNQIDKLINLIIKINEGLSGKEQQIDITSFNLKEILNRKQPRTSYEIQNIILLLSQIGDTAQIFETENTINLLQKFRSEYQVDLMNSLQQIKIKIQKTYSSLHLSPLILDALLSHNKEHSNLSSQIKTQMKDIMQRTVIEYLQPIQSEVCLNMEQLKFSPDLIQFTSNSIILSNNGRVATQTQRGRNNQGRNQFALLEPSLSKKQKWRIRINNMVTQIFLGVCSFTELQKQEFNYFFQTQYRFGFMISQYCNTSRSWNNQKEEENDKIIEFSFQTGDIVDLYFDSEAGKILFQKNDEQQYALIAEFQTYMYFDLYAAVFLWDVKDEVEILDNE